MQKKIENENKFNILNENFQNIIEKFEGKNNEISILRKNFLSLKEIYLLKNEKIDINIIKSNLKEEEVIENNKGFLEVISEEKKNMLSILNNSEKSFYS